MSRTIEMFAIRHIPTGFYLRTLGAGRGMTLREPEEVNARQLPRMFVEYKTASRALQAWLRGKYLPEHDDDYGRSWSKIQKVLTRKAEDMEIVPITLELP